jgi:hypothetical protein
MNHEPDGRFIEHLEWQLETALRRRERFARPTSRRHLAVVRSAALAVVCLLCGAGVVIGAERMQQSRDKEFLLTQNEIRARMARGRLEAGARAHDRARQLHGAALIGADEMRASAFELRALEHALRELELDREEIELSGRAPERRLGAPLVHRRDFVSEHLWLAVERDQERLALEAQRYERAKQLADAGFVSSRELAGQEAALQSCAAEVALRERLLALRGDFLLGRIDERRLSLLELRAAAETRVERARLDVRRALEELDHAARLEAAGAAANESGKLEQLVQLRTGELELAELELAMIDEQLRD